MSKGLKPQLKKNVADTEKNKAFNRANRDFQLYFSNRIYSLKKKQPVFWQHFSRGGTYFREYIFSAAWPLRPFAGKRWKNNAEP